MTGVRFLHFALTARHSGGEAKRLAQSIVDAAKSADPKSACVPVGFGVAFILFEDRKRAMAFKKRKRYWFKKGVLEMAGDAPEAAQR